MPVIFDVDELVINDSFINFCFNANAEDYLFWQQYIQKNPAELQTLQEAKRRIQMLHEMASKKKPEISRYIAKSESKIRYGYFNTFIKIAAVFLLLFGG